MHPLFEHEPHLRQAERRGCGRDGRRNGCRVHVDSIHSVPVVVLLVGEEVLPVDDGITRRGARRRLQCNSMRISVGFFNSGLSFL
jgi:hypothetical protein